MLSKAALLIAASAISAEKHMSEIWMISAFTMLFNDTRSILCIKCENREKGLETQSPFSRRKCFTRRLTLFEEQERIDCEVLVVVAEGRGLITVVVGTKSFVFVNVFVVMSLLMSKVMVAFFRQKSANAERTNPFAHEINAIFSRLSNVG
jgi:hypothetical protein